MALTREERVILGRKRILSVLTTHVVCNLRTLEHKIADAGPTPQRIQPHILTESKNSLAEEGRIIIMRSGEAQWLHLADAAPERLAARLEELQAIWRAFSAAAVTRRTGQAMEIAVFRALVASGGAAKALGGFIDLDEYPDDKLYSKNDIHALGGRSLGKRSLDFIVDVGGIYCGIEVKNVRPWLYTHEDMVREAIGKAIILDIVPVIIGRRIPYVTFRLLSPCGVILHETYNQRMANADLELSEHARHKNLLGYHDIRVGNQADERLSRFVTESLPKIAPTARAKFEEHQDLLSEFALGTMPYTEFAARVRRREGGQLEDNDWTE